MLKSRNAFIGLVAVALLGLAMVASADRAVVIDDWTTNPVSQRGIPSGWTGEGFGQRADYDFTIEQAGEARVLHLKSNDEHSTIVRDITGKVRLKETPILEWTWKATFFRPVATSDAMSQRTLRRNSM